MNNLKSYIQVTKSLLSKSIFLGGYYPYLITAELTFIRKILNYYKQNIEFQTTNLIFDLLELFTRVDTSYSELEKNRFLFYLTEKKDFIIIAHMLKNYVQYCERKNNLVLNALIKSLNYMQNDDLTID
jgi:hypothetical protein